MGYHVEFPSEHAGYYVKFPASPLRENDGEERHAYVHTNLRRVEGEKRLGSKFPGVETSDRDDVEDVSTRTLTWLVGVEQDWMHNGENSGDKFILHSDGTLRCCGRNGPWKQISERTITATFGGICYTIKYDGTFQTGVVLKPNHELKTRIYVQWQTRCFGKPHEFELKVEDRVLVVPDENEHNDQ